MSVRRMYSFIDPVSSAPSMPLNTGAANAVEAVPFVKLCEAVVASVGAVGLTVTATVQESLFVTSS